MARPLAWFCALALAACSVQLPAENPFDPSTPTGQKAKARLTGALSAPSLQSLADLTVQLEQGAKLAAEAKTDAAGRFLFADVSPGQYALKTAPAGFAAIALFVTLNPGDELDLGVIRLTLESGDAVGAISGLATLEGASDHSGTLVEVIGRSFTALTDTTGGFRIPIVAGSYDLRFTHADYVAFTLTSIDVAKGEERKLDPVVLQANPAKLLGHVDAERAGADPGPLADATVSIDGASSTAQTNAAGDFALTNVPPGSHLVRVSKTGYRTLSAPVFDLLGGESRTLADPFALVLARGGVKGTLSLADSSDASGVIVEVTGTGRALVTGSDGAFLLNELIAGSYEIAARRDGYARRVLGTFDVQPDVVLDAGAFKLSRAGGALTIVQGNYTRAPQITLQTQATGVVGLHLSEDPAFADPALGDVETSDWRPYTPNKSYPFTLSDKDGQHEVFVVFTDGLNTSAPASATVVLDRVAPAQPSVVINDGGPFTRAPGGIVTLALNARDLPATTGAAVAGLAKVHLANNPGFTNEQVLEFNLTASWTLDLPTLDGAKTVYARFEDRAGNVSASATANVRLDTVEPTGTISGVDGPSATPGVTNSPLVTVRLSGADANAGERFENLFVRVGSDAGLVGARYQPYTPSISWLLAQGDGDKTIYAQFMDAAGNESLVVNATIALDTTAPGSPSVSITETDARPTNGFTKVLAVTLSLSATGTPVEAQVSEDPAFGGAVVEVPIAAGAVFPLSQAFTLGGAGVRTVFARFVDAAGNFSAAARASVTVDQAPPSAIPVTVVQGLVVSATAVDVLVPAAGEDELSIAGTGVASSNAFVAAVPGLTTPVTLKSGDGAKQLVVTYRDLAENTTVLPALSVLLDTTGPSLSGVDVTGTLVGGTAGVANAVTATTAVVVDLKGVTDGTGAGVTQMKLSNKADLSDATWQPYKPTSQWRLEAQEGLQKMYVLLRDAAGNESAPPSVGSVTLDTQGPSQPVVTLNEGDARPTNGFTKSTAITALLSASGTPVLAQVSEDQAFGSGVTNVTIASGAPQPISQAFTLAGTGSRTIYARFADAAGNWSATARAAVTVDQTPPASVPASIVEGAVVSITAINVLAPAAGQDEISIGGSGVATATAFAPSTPGLAVPVTLKSGDGAKQVVVTYRDLAENTTVLPALSVLLDTTVPTLASMDVTGSLVGGSVGVANAVTASTGVVVELKGVSDGTGSGATQMRISNRPDLSDATWQPYKPISQWRIESAEGLERVYASVRDVAGLESAVVTGSITLDTTPPSTPVVTINEGDARPTNGFTRNTAITALLSAGGTPVSAQVSEDPAFGTGVTNVTIANGASQPLSQAFTLGGVGSRTIYARFADAAGNWSASARTSVLVDQTAPAAVPVTIAEGLVVTGTAINVIAPNAGQDEISVGGTGLLSSSAFVASVPGVAVPATLKSGDGAKQLVVTYRDLAENTTVLPALSVLLDAAPPTASGVNVTGLLADGTAGTVNAVTAVTSVTLDLVGVSDGSGSGVTQVRVSNRSDLADAVWQPYRTPIAWTLDANDGTRFVYVSLRDAAGNTQNPAITGSIELAARPPSAGSIVVEGGAAATKNATAPVVVSATGATDYALSTDFFATAPVWKTLSGGTTKSDTVSLPAPDGRKVVSVRFRNKARVEGAGASAGIDFDTTPPSATSLTLQGSLGDGSTSTTFTSTNAVVASVAWLATDTSISEMTLVQSPTCTFPGTPVWQPASPATTFVLSGADGAKKVCVLLRDRAGNVQQTAASATLTLDSHPPSNPVFTTVPRTYTTLAAFPVSLTTSTDNLGGTVTYECSGGVDYPNGFVDCGTTPPTKFNLVPNADNTIGIKARDDSRNESAASFLRLVHDNQVPRAPAIQSVRATAGGALLTWAPSASTDVASYRVVYGGTPAGGGSDALQGASPIDVGGGVVSGTSLQATLSGLAVDAPYYVSVYARDNAGNDSLRSESRLVYPNRVAPRVVTTFGGSFQSLGSRGTKVYAAERLSLVQLDIATDAQAPQVTGRVSLPNLVPTSGTPAVGACTVNSVAGECVFVALQHSQIDFRDTDLSLRAGLFVIFFPPGGTAAAPVLGTIVGYLPTAADVVLLAASGSTLFTVDSAGAQAFDVTDATHPTLITTTAFAGGAAPVTVRDAGLVGNTLYVLGRDGVTNPRFFSFDVTAPAIAMPASAWAPPRTRLSRLLADSLEPYPTGNYLGIYGPTSVGLAYVEIDNAGTDTRVAVSRYTPGSGSYPLPAQSYVAWSEGNLNEDMHLTAAVSGPDNAYLLAHDMSSGNLQGWTVNLSTFTAGLPLPSVGAFFDYLGPATVTKFSGAERLIATQFPGGVGQVAAQTVARWRNTGTTLTASGLPVWDDSGGTLLASSENYLVVTRAPELRVIDVSNPLLPRVTARVTTTITTPQALVAHGANVYLGGTTGLGGWKILADGSLSAIGSVSGLNVATIATSGPYVFVGKGASATGIVAYKQGAGVLTQVATAGLVNVAAIEARANIVYTATTAGALQTFTFNPTANTFAALSPATPVAYPVASPTGLGLTVRGTVAVVSSTRQSFTADVTNPASPVFDPLPIKVATPVLLQSGYLVGSADYASNYGPRFQPWLGSSPDGTLPFMACTPPASLVALGPVLATTCGANGTIVFTALSSTGGSLAKTVDKCWAGTALSGDGMFTFQGGAFRDCSTGANTMFYENDQNLAFSNAYPLKTQPVELTTMPQGFPGSMLQTEGVLLSAEYSPAAALVAYDVSKPMVSGPNAWPQLGRVSFTYTNSSGFVVNASPTYLAFDGDYAYVADGGFLAPVYVVDLRNRAAPSIVATIPTGATNRGYAGVAAHRQRLYVARYDSPGITIQVYDTTNPAAPSLMTAWPVSIPGVSGYQLPTYLSPNGRFLAFAYTRGTRDNGLAIVKLGANRDGAGATLVGTWDTPNAIANPTWAGDVLYVQHGYGLASFDLTPLYASGTMPTFLSTFAVGDGASAGTLMFQGPFAYLRTPTSYRVYDLR